MIKKIFFAILISLSLAALSSCDLAMDILFEEDEESTTESTESTETTEAGTQTDDSNGETASGNTSEIRNSIIALAREQIGIYYQSGGISPSTGFDCSGLVYYCYTQNNVTIPRTSYDQYHGTVSTTGTHIAKSETKLADLVSFDPDGDGRVSHSGMFIDSETFIHSPRTGRTVCEDSLIGYWGECTIGYTNYIND